MTQPTFRPYRPGDREALLAIFDANCPAFFAPNERADLDAYLGTLEPASPAGPYDYGYVVVEVDGAVVGAHGVRPDRDSDGCRLTWILHAPASQGRGLGRHVMERVFAVARQQGARTVGIATSDKSSEFFARFGAIVEGVTPDGWGPGMDRIDMRAPVPSAR